MLGNVTALAPSATLAAVLLLGGCQSPFMAGLSNREPQPSAAADILAVPPPTYETMTPEADLAASEPAPHRPRLHRQAHLVRPALSQRSRPHLSGLSPERQVAPAHQLAQAPAREPLARPAEEGPILIQPGAPAQRTLPDPPALRTVAKARPGPRPASLAPAASARPALLAPIHKAQPGTDTTPY